MGFAGNMLQFVVACLLLIELKIITPESYIYLVRKHKTDRLNETSNRKKHSNEDDSLQVLSNTIENFKKIMR